MSARTPGVLSAPLSTASLSETSESIRRIASRAAWVTSCAPAASTFSVGGLPGGGAAPSDPPRSAIEAVPVTP